MKIRPPAAVTVLAIVAVVAVLFSLAPVRRVAPAIRRTDLGTMTNVMFETLEDRRLLAFVPPADPRVVTSLDSGWKFLRADAVNAQTVAFNDTSWSNVNVPHTWNAIDGQDGGNNYYRGIGWYRKHVTPDVSLAGKSLYLKFDGANLTTDLYIDGLLVGQHKGGYSAFGWDVSSLLSVGADHVIAVKVTNANDANVAPLTGDYTMSGGIYRHVNLIATNTEHAALQEFVPADTSGTPIGPTVSYWVNTPGVYLKPTNVTAASADLNITTNVRNDSGTVKTLTVVSDVVDAAGNLVTELSSAQSVGAGANFSFVHSTSIANPHLWNGVSDPYLYKVYITVKQGATVRDLTQQPLGFRTFSVDPNAGGMLNGQYYDLHGANFHQDRLDKGWAISDADQVEDVNLIQEMGSTFVRLSHYQHPQLTYDLLDQRGIAAWSEVPINGTGSGNLPSTADFLNNAKQQLQEMIRQNFNHPAVLVWGLFNEISDNTTNRNVITALKNLAHQEDPTRQTTGASNQSVNGALNATPDQFGVNWYFGWYSGTYSQVASSLDSAKASIPGRSFGMSEYGAGAGITQHQDNPPQPNPSGLFHPEEYQNLFHEAYWIAMKSRPWVWHKTIWNMFDFAADGRNEGDTPGRNDKGMVTYDRQTRKDAFYFYKANWSPDPVLYITSRRFTSRSANTIPIKIYANMDSVTLKVNGVTIGTINSAAAPDKIFQWNNIAIQEGTNLVEVTGTRGAQTYTDSVTFNNILPLAQIPALTGTPLARINFQPAASTAIAGYSPDNGFVFGVRPDGKSYGWDADNTANTRERTTGFLATPPDSRYTRLNHLQRNGVFVWELAVPNGTYDVHLVAGDAGFIDSSHVIDLEGRIALMGTPTATAPWVESMVRVTVNDGRLTVSSDVSSNNAKIVYIDVNSTAFAHLDDSMLNLDFDGSSNPITLATSGGNITTTRNGTTYLFASASVAEITGNGTASADHLIVSSPISQALDFPDSGGSDLIEVSAGGSLLFDENQQLHALSIAGGSVTLAAAGNRTLYLDSLTLDPAGRLDLADNDLVVNNGDFTTIRDLVIAGFGNTAGITSSTSTGSSILALFDNAPVGAADWNGQPISAAAIVGKYTWFGDANLDGQVTGDDYTVIDANLNTTPLAGLAWLSGDMNLDGAVTGDDYTVIDANLGLGSGSPLIPSSAGRATKEDQSLRAETMALLD